MTALLVAAYLSAIIAANLLVAAFGPGISIVNAFVFVGLDLTTRDRLHEAWSGRLLWPRMAVLIGAGGAISYLVNEGAGPIAVASTVSFVVASVVDSAVFAALHGRARELVRVNGSNVVSAAVDSVLFPTLAFGAFLPLVVLGQFAAKVLGGAIWSFVLFRRDLPVRRPAT